VQPGYAQPGQEQVGYAQQGYAQPGKPSFEQPTYPQEGAASYPQPTPYPQPAVYPTNPPWATAPAPDAQQHEPPQAGAGEPVPVVGGLLVPFPEEMNKVSRAQAPALWPVAVFTFLLPFLGLIFGLVAAVRRSGRARRGGSSAAPYWITWAVSVVAASFVWLVLAVTVVMPAWVNYYESVQLKAVQSNVLHDGQLAKANVSASEAECHASSDRRADGTRDYLCRLTLGSGENGQITVTADTSGNWTPMKTS